MAFKAIEKKWGKGVIRKYKDSGARDIDRFSTGSLVINDLIGGGWPRGRIIEAYGEESSGKTTIFINGLAELQKMGEPVAFIDLEQALDPAWVAINGLNLDEVYVSQPDTAEMTLDIVMALCGNVSAVVVDSVAAMVPKAELEGELEDAQVGLMGRLMSKGLRQLNKLAAQTGTTIFFTNQQRDKIGQTGYGDNKTTTGGNALKFYASVRLQLYRSQVIKVGETPVGNKITVSVRKNKVGTPFQKGSIDVYYDEGISNTSYLIELAIQKNIIERAGAWYKIPIDGTDEPLTFQGAHNLRTAINSDNELYQHIQKEVLNGDI